MCDDKMGQCVGHQEGGCGCGGHGGCCGHRMMMSKHLLCLLISLSIGILVFCVGIKVGEMKAIYQGYGYGKMLYRGYPMMGSSVYYGMMQTGPTSTVK